MLERKEEEEEETKEEEEPEKEQEERKRGEGKRTGIKEDGRKGRWRNIHTHTGKGCSRLVKMEAWLEEQS